MKTIATQKIDGYNIIIGIYDAGGLIDPVATNKVVAVKMAKSEVWKSIEAIKAQMKTYAYQALQAKRNAKNAATESEKRAFVEEANARTFQAQELQGELKPLATELDTIRRAMVVEHAIYFSPKPGDLIVTDADAENTRAVMVEATAAGQVVDSDLKKIDNFRGKKFWKKSGSEWVGTEITKLGVKPVTGAIEEKSLTDIQRAEVSEQIETDRIKALPTAAKTKEKDLVIAGLKSQAGLLKTEYEVLGESKPLEKAQKWLADEIVKVEAKYS